MQMASFVSTGTELILWGAEDDEGVDVGAGARFDLESREWTRLPAIVPPAIGYEGNPGSQSILWTGKEAVVFVGALGTGLDPTDALVFGYSPSTNEWRHIGTIPGFATWFSPDLRVDGDSLLVAGKWQAALSMSP